MLKNYIKTTLRYLWRNKLFTVLNIVGLSIGISACWMVFSIVHYELSFDKKIPEAEHVYQVVSETDYDGSKSGFAGVPLGMAPLLVEESLDDALVVPVYSQHSERLFIPQDGQKELILEEQEDFVGTLPGYFDLLPYEWIAGNARTAFLNPNNVVLTEERAKTYFPKNHPSELIGKTMWADTTQLVVSGVVKNLPFPSSFGGKVFLSIPKREWNDHNWGGMNSNHTLYVKTKNQASLQHLIRIAEKHYQETAAQEHLKIGVKISFHTFPLLEKHFEPQYDPGNGSTDKKILYGLIAIGGFLLLLASINYINLSTAQVPQRAREIGVRKTLGAKPVYLTLSFLTETCCIALFALVLSWPMTTLFRKAYPEFVPDGMHYFDNTWVVISFLFVLITGISLLASLYPAYLINKVRAVETLKGKPETTIKGTKLTLRKALIVFQFVIAQFFIASVLIIGQQLEFTLRKDLGFARDAIVTIQMPYKSYQDADVDPFLYKQALKKYPEIASIALGHEPQSNNHWVSLYYFDADTGQIQLTTPRKYIDKDYIDLYQIELLAGRNIHQTDTMRDILINETALKDLGLTSPKQVIGKFLVPSHSPNVRLTIVGVFRDFHQKSLHTNIAPLMFGSSNARSSLRFFHIKLPDESKSWPKAFTAMEKEWKKVYPNAPFEYKFINDQIKTLYESEQRTAKIIGLATGVMILTSCLGLFGLATLTAFQRTKEIGIRKVLGSSVTGIIALLSKDYIKLIIIAIVVATPLAWWGMNKWLEDFAYRIDIEWWMLLSAGILTIVIALLSVSYQAIRAARANPVESLRDE